MKQIALKMAMLSRFLQVLRNLMQWTMNQITIWNGHTQPMLAFSDRGRPRVASMNVLFYVCAQPMRENATM